jgi:hypothetical protein
MENALGIRYLKSRWRWLPDTEDVQTMDILLYRTLEAKVKKHAMSASPDFPFM